MFFVNLPLRYVARNVGWLDYFIDPDPERALAGYGPELGLDSLAIQHLGTDWHVNLSKRLERAGCACSIHLPFFDLSPGSLDDLVLEATRKRLLSALEFARFYRPRHLVGHVCHHHDQHAGDNFGPWLERSTRTWSSVLETWPDRPPLFLENTHESGPEPTFRLVEALRDYNVGVCFDVGHWHSFSKGRERRNLTAWLDTLAPLIGHLHLHDNDGTSDQHLGLGQGTIPWADFFSELRTRALRPTITFEPHTTQAMSQTLSYVNAHPLFFEPLRSGEADE